MNISSCFILLRCCVLILIHFPSVFNVFCVWRWNSQHVLILFQDVWSNKLVISYKNFLRFILLFWGCWVEFVVTEQFRVKFREKIYLNDDHDWGLNKLAWINKRIFCIQWRKKKRDLRQLLQERLKTSEVRESVNCSLKEHQIPFCDSCKFLELSLSRGIRLERTNEKRNDKRTKKQEQRTSYINKKFFTKLLFG